MHVLKTTVDDFSQQASGPGGNAQPVCTHKKYEPEDFSQKAINKGQRRINYELTEAGKKLAEALGLLTKALATSPCSESDLAKVNAVIKEASDISSTVADIIPPGCDGK